MPGGSLAFTIPFLQENGGDFIIILFFCVITGSFLAWLRDTSFGFVHHLAVRVVGPTCDKGGAENWSAERIQAWQDLYIL